MSLQLILNHADVQKLILALAGAIEQIHCRSEEGIKLYPIPRGGVPVAYLVLAALSERAEIVDDPAEATCFVDDLLDSGATLCKWSDAYPGIPFLTLIDKQAMEDYTDKWIVFPWERANDEDLGIEDNIRRIMQFIGENPDREGLLETPKRVAKAMAHWYRGYNMDPKAVMKVFEDGAEGTDEMVIVEDIPFFSHCEHHMAPFFGTATIAYIPDGRIIGISKIPRLLEIFASRMQVQERLTTQVAEALMEHLKPLGCGVFINARHLCMESRGIQKSGASTSTIALRGVFKDQLSTRNEFMAIARK